MKSGDMKVQTKIPPFGLTNFSADNPAVTWQPVLLDPKMFPPKTSTLG